jgi:hypothetical protein
MSELEMWIINKLQEQRYSLLRINIQPDTVYMSSYCLDVLRTQGHYVTTTPFIANEKLNHTVMGMNIIEVVGQGNEYLRVVKTTYL